MLRVKVQKLQRNQPKVGFGCSCNCPRMQKLPWTKLTAAYCFCPFLSWRMLVESFHARAWCCDDVVHCMHSNFCKGLAGSTTSPRILYSLSLLKITTMYWIIICHIKKPKLITVNYYCYCYILTIFIIIIIIISKWWETEKEL